MRRFGFLLVVVNIKRPSSSNCGSGSFCCKLAAINSLKSTYFPATIWWTNFAGIGENPGPTTNGCSRIGDTAALDATTDVARRGAEQIDCDSETGSEKVLINEGTIGLPAVPVTSEVENPPEARKSFAWHDKFMPRLDGGTFGETAGTLGTLGTRNAEVWLAMDACTAAIAAWLAAA